MLTPPELDVVKTTEIFLVPSSILIGALGIAPTEQLKTGISVVGLLSAVLWVTCSFTAPPGWDVLRFAVLKGMPVLFGIFWIVATTVHFQL